MSGFLLRVCAANRLPNTLLHEERRLTEPYHRVLVARAAARLRRLRAFRAPATHLQKRRKLRGRHSLEKLIQRHPDMASLQQQQLRRRCSSAADRAPADPLAGKETTTTTTLSATDNVTPIAIEVDSAPEVVNASCNKLGSDAEAMPPPPLPAPSDGGSPTRHSRSTSVASRNANRLSLTLPIALPTNDPSRPIPTSATTSSVPPTPIDSPAVKTPSGTNEFIIAVAAQERRVLELREELSRAEADLVTLKKQWTAQEAAQKRNAARNQDSSRNNTPTPDDDSLAARRSVDLDRRKSLMLGQNTPTSTPGRRRVLRGGHTRTLSLLSPPKSDSGFAVHEDRESDALKLPPAELRTAQLTNPTLSKRASWQPRMHQHTPSSPAMPQLVEDFRSGLRAFVEDIRQITVGDEPITGQPARSPGGTSTGGETPKDRASSQDTIKASQAPRPDLMAAFDLPGSAISTPTPVARTKDMTREKSKPVKSKRFSWQPLGFDSLDDTDWSNWDSPASAKSARWSGSTVNSGTMDETPSIPEKDEEMMTRYVLSCSLWRVTSRLT